MRRILQPLFVFSFGCLILLPGTNILASNLFEGSDKAFVYAVFAAVCMSVTAAILMPDQNDSDEDIYDEWDEEEADEYEDSGRDERRRRIRLCWNREVEEIHKKNLSEDQLLPTYRRVVLRLYDAIDLHKAERYTDARPSLILRKLQRTRYSFRHFCQAIGK